MCSTKHLIFATTLLFQAAALPAANPNDDDFACWTSSHAYLTSSESYEESYSTELVSTAESTSWSTNTDVPLTTLCDGQARALEPYKTIAVTVTETLKSPTPTSFFSTYTEPTPTCTIAESACTAIIASKHLGYKFCTTNPPYIPCTSHASAWCNLRDEGRSTLFYWPVTTVSGDFCLQDGTTVFALPTSPPEPNKVVVDGYTFSSPTNYMSFDVVSADVYSRVGSRTAMHRCGGPPKENVVFPITESLYSGNRAEDATWSFNFADLNTVPVEAYSRQAKCDYAPESCVGVIADQAEYTPIIVIPTDLANLKPEEWKAAGCVGTKQAYDMPRVALATPAPSGVNMML
jgi:hypothetical protein